MVRTYRFANGSQFAYGHDGNDTVTSISQSTEEGEENFTQTRYTYGQVTELVSGNNVVRYAEPSLKVGLLTTVRIAIGRIQGMKPNLKKMKSIRQIL